MTNKQKAKEIAAKYCEYYDGSKEADSTSYNSAMEMARWKDEEIKKLKKEIADGEKFREELKRLCNERLDDRIALENENIKLKKQIKELESELEELRI